MGYIPTEWQTGDIITAEKLNKAEEGIAANSKLVYVAKANVGEGQLQPVFTQGTFADACAVLDAGGLVVLQFSIANLEGYSEYISCKYYPEGTPAIELFSVQLGAGDLALTGIEWTESGLTQWPPV